MKNTLTFITKSRCYNRLIKYKFYEPLSTPIKIKLLSRVIIETICIIFVCLCTSSLERRKSKSPVGIFSPCKIHCLDEFEKKIGETLWIFISKSWLCLIYVSEFIFRRKNCFSFHKTKWSARCELVSMTGWLACIGVRAMLNFVWKIF